MLILGLTGSMAMGKSRTAAMFARHGIPVFDSDRYVHELYAPGGAAIRPLLARFPDCGSPDGGIDRPTLAACIQNEPGAIRVVEAIVHKLVRAGQRAFLERQARAGAWLSVLDIPLLYESLGHRRCDRTAVVSASGFMQSQRALARPGMSSARLKLLLARQMPDAQKRQRGDFLIPSGGDRGMLARHVQGIIRAMRETTPAAWPDRW